MTESINMRSLAWHRALTLVERTSLLRSTHSRPTDGEVENPTLEQRIEQWRAQRPFAEGPYFKQWLALNELNEADLREIIAMSGCLPCEMADELPQWVEVLEDAYADALATTASGDASEPQLGGLLTVLEPLIQHWRQDLRARVHLLLQDYPDHPFDPATIEDIVLSPLHQLITEKINRTLILELHVAKLRNQLPGETPEERFQSFVARLRQLDTVQSLFDEYPVLARRVSDIIQRWVATSLEFLTRLCADRSAICAGFGRGELGHLVAISVNGDMHDGHAVSLLTFSCGWRLVYRPGPIAVYRHMHELLEWCNQCYTAQHSHGPLGNSPLFRPLTVLECDGYGWVEYIALQPCPDPAAVQRFYYRQGGYLALLYCLAAIDFHHENLIAVGEHPVLVDLETLFHPPVHLLFQDSTDAEMRAMDDLHRSVQSIGLLPQQMWINKESAGVELSGLGGKSGQRSPRRVPTFDSVNTDAMQIVYRHVEMETAQNRPTLMGLEVSVLAYADTVVQGFTDIYRLLQANRSALLAEDGPISRFANDSVRVIVRPTLLYVSLLRDAWHPNMLRDALVRDQLFDKLWEGVPFQPTLARLIPFEQQSLWCDDIPLFRTHPDSRDLWSDRGDRITQFLPESGMESVQRRLHQLGDADLARQIWYIRAAFTTLVYDSDTANRAPPGLLPMSRPVPRSALLDGARQIGDRLEHLALRGSDGVSWVGITEIRGVATSTGLVGSELYDGTGGIALFLGQLGALSGEARYTDLARHALATLRLQLARRRKHEQGLIGGFEGWGSAIYIFTHLGDLWNEPTLWEEASEIVSWMSPLIEQDRAFDILSGAAGSILSLLGLHHCTGSTAARNLAHRCGTHLVTHAEPRAGGIGWSNHIPSTQPLTGFAHGAAGIAWALTELAATTGDDLFRATARAALAYERELFSPADGTWPDFRALSPNELDNAVGEHHTAYFWCHGAPGIGLSRILISAHLEDNALNDEIDHVLGYLPSHCLGAGHCLCHGDMGNLEVLLQAALRFHDTQLMRQTYHLAASILDRTATRGWLCGIPMGIETPGLMTGLAGIGYQLLRLAEPERVPAVLSLEPPLG